MRRHPRKRTPGILAWVLFALGQLVLLALPHGAAASPNSMAGAFIIWPQGAVAFPAGRFAEEDAPQLKPGHEAGLSLGGDLGYGLSQFLYFGAGYSFTDFGQTDVDPTVESGQTTAHTVQAWGRVFLLGAYQYWRPYVLVGVGASKPTSELNYDPPQYGLGGIPDSTVRLESTVGWVSEITAGVGVLVPLGRIGLSLEPRYVSIHSKGADRTDTFHFTDGTSFEGTIGGDGNRLRAKSNTNWWEVRFGVVLHLN